MTEQWIMIAVAGVAVWGIEALIERRTRLERESYKRREDALMKLVHNQSNRLSAKTLTDYMALEHEDLRRRGTSPKDERAEEREALRESLVQDELASILEQNGATTES